MLSELDGFASGVVAVGIKRREPTIAAGLQAKLKINFSVPRGSTSAIRELAIFFQPTSPCMPKRSRHCELRFGTLIQSHDLPH